MVLPFSSVEIFSINISEKHELFRRAVREFMERDVAPMWRKVKGKVIYLERS